MPNKRELINYLYKLYCYIENKDYLLFHKENYKWIIGADIIYMIIDENIYQKCSSYEYGTLFGIPIELDYKNREKIQIWKNITDEL